MWSPVLGQPQNENNELNPEHASFSNSDVRCEWEVVLNRLSNAVRYGLIRSNNLTLLIALDAHIAGKRWANVFEQKMRRTRIELFANFVFIQRCHNSRKLRPRHLVI
jgi:hypothetical protein